MRILPLALLGTSAVCMALAEAPAQELERQLQGEPPRALAQAARAQGDARRGAIAFHQPHVGCAKCHEAAGGDETLGPDLARPGGPHSDAELVESVLFPSLVIRKGYELTTVVTAGGKTITGLPVEEAGGKLVLRDASDNGRLVTLDPGDIEERVVNKTSIMPAGQVNQLSSRQQFLDLLRYLFEIRDGGPARAAELQPPASAIVLAVPDYELRIDHAGLIAGLDDAAFRRGEAIYNRLCVNCHGTHEAPGTLPTAPRFAAAAFKNGGDPYRMYRTLTYGFGMMVPQTWMVPKQKYDVIHYVREAYLEEHNPSEHFAVTPDYLAGLPAGDARGPEPSSIEPWSSMDYGPSLINTYEIGGDGTNFAHKGIAVRLDSGPGGVSRGRAWMIFDHDTLRVAAAWTGEGFIDWNGIHFNGRHQAHPRIVGDVQFANPSGPGWANPETGRFEDTLRVAGRDGRRYGPLPREWAHYDGLFHCGHQVVIEYTVGGTAILEMPGMEIAGSAPVFMRTFKIGPHAREFVLQVARRPEEAALLRAVTRHGAAGVDALVYGPLAVGVSPPIAGAEWVTTVAGDLRLRIPPAGEPLKFTLWTARVDDEAALDDLLRMSFLDRPARDLAALTHGGPRRWTENLPTTPRIGDESGPFAVDVLTIPADNPWLAQLRIGGFDFLDGGGAAAVCTWDGDVWLVRGLNTLPATSSTSNAVDAGPQLVWQRIASGLFQPLGLKVIDGRIHVACRDQIVVLHDRNGDGETDFYENFNNDHQVTEHFHEFATGLQTDAAGNLYYAKAARHALPALVPQHGTLLRVAADGSRTEILATGFRAPNGVCVNDDGTFVVTDQEGHWTPKNRINWIREGGFYGNMWGYHDVEDPSNAAMQQPLCWITNSVDRSPAEPLWVDSDAWGPLSGSLLYLSYGEGKLYVVLHETAARTMQGGVCELPVPTFPTGIMRGRFHPRDGQLYTGGLFAWAGNQQEPGGWYRVRYTGKPLHVPVGLHAAEEGLTITFTNPLDRPSATDAGNYSVRAWSLKRSAEYGSPHVNERRLKVAAAELSSDGRSVLLRIPELQPTWCMSVGYTLLFRDGGRVAGGIHNTVHALRR